MPSTLPKNAATTHTQPCRLPDTIPQAGLQSVVFGLILIVFIIFEPYGLYGRWLKIRTWFDVFPFYRRGTFRRQRTYLRSERLR